MATATAKSGNSGKRIQLRNQSLDISVNVNHRVRIHYKLLRFGILALATAAANEIGNAPIRTVTIDRLKLTDRMYPLAARKPTAAHRSRAMSPCDRSIRGTGCPP